MPARASDGRIAPDASGFFARLSQLHCYYSSPDRQRQARHRFSRRAGATGGGGEARRGGPAGSSAEARHIGETSSPLRADRRELLLGLRL